MRELVELVNELERVAADLQGGVGELRREVDDEFSSVREKQAREFERLWTRLSRLETSQGAGTAPTLSGTDRTWPVRSQPRQEFRRTDPSVVTMEPQAGESEVCGSAWPPVRDRRYPHLSRP